MGVRNYQMLSQQNFGAGGFELVPIRDEDKFQIMQWRNEQIDILRQKRPLTREEQERYFVDVIEKLFTSEHPEQLLFSVLENKILIGYGGLVHIDWDSGNAEISFITATERNVRSDQFIQDWKCFLELVKTIAFG